MLERGEPKGSGSGGGIAVALAVWMLIMWAACAVGLLLGCPTERAEMGVYCEPIRGIAARRGISAADALGGVVIAPLFLMTVVYAALLVAWLALPLGRGPLHIALLSSLAVASVVLLSVLAAHGMLEDLVVWFAGRKWALLLIASGWFAVLYITVKHV